jgi:hypothetical protein
LDQFRLKRQNRDLFLVIVRHDLTFAQIKSVTLILTRTSAAIFAALISRCAERRSCADSRASFLQRFRSADFTVRRTEFVVLILARISAVNSAALISRYSELEFLR